MTEISSSPSDVLKLIKDHREQNELHEREFAEKLMKVERERQLLQKTLYESANPSPIYITLLVVFIVIVLYIIYMMFFKPCMTGTWLDHTGTEWNIIHNRFTGNFTVKKLNENDSYGNVADNYVQYGNLTGIWNYKDTIKFLEGWTLQRVVKI